MMQNFILDLREARRKSGLTQSECAELIGVNKSQLSKIENGERMPSLMEICALSIIYGRSFESLFSSLFDEIRADIAVSLDQLDMTTKDGLDNIKRKSTLDRLHEYLNALTNAQDEG